MDSVLSRLMRRSMSFLLRLFATAVRAAGPSEEPADGCSRAKTARISAQGASVAARILDLTPDPHSTESDVLHYHLDIEAEPAQSWLGGFNTMTIRSVKDPLSVFRFRLNQALLINSVTANGAMARWRRLDSATVEVTLPRPYPSGSVS
jgi:hypothetical protein